MISGGGRFLVQINPSHIKQAKRQNLGKFVKISFLAKVGVFSQKKWGTNKIEYVCICHGHHWVSGLISIPTFTNYHLPLIRVILYLNQMVISCIQNKLSSILFFYPKSYGITLFHNISRGSLQVVKFILFLLKKHTSRNFLLTRTSTYICRKLKRKMPNIVKWGKVMVEVVIIQNYLK